MPTTALIADLHADSLEPECRTDNYLDALCTKFSWLTTAYNNLIIAGDLFDHWKTDPYVVNRLLDAWNRKCKIYAIPGQHDLPQHSLELIDKSSFQILVNSGVITRLRPDVATRIDGWDVFGAGWGEEWPRHIDNPLRPQLLVGHKTTWMDPFAPGQAQGDAARLLMANPGWEGILVGDNHKTFFVQAGKRALVSPGSIMRMRVDQMNHRPCVYTLGHNKINADAEYIPIEDIMSDVVANEKKDKDARVTAFVTRLGEQKEVGLSFTDNMKQYLEENEVNDSVKRIISECTGG